jgi:hypothetical protein
MGKKECVLIQNIFFSSKTFNGVVQSTGVSKEYKIYIPLFQTVQYMEVTSFKISMVFLYSKETTKVAMKVC